LENGLVTGVIVAAGSGSRMGVQSIPKQFLSVGGIPILGHTLKKFENSVDVDQLVLVIRQADRTRCDDIITTYHINKVRAIVEGGQQRQDSVFQGLKHADSSTEIVLIHDAVRMFITEGLIRELIRDARYYGASITAVPAKDTIKQVQLQNLKHLQPSGFSGENDAVFVVKTFERSTLWQVQTPQAFQYQLIFDFHRQAEQQGLHATDDAMLAEYFGQPVKIVEGSYRNIKITTPDDLLIAEAFWKDQCQD
jgi:2-C-methyl-D-erythritol 4-phosphate cytidylyltransferase